jgi:hypothetical protein
MSVLSPSSELAENALKPSVNSFGPIEREIGPLPFDFTSYYDKEMGSGIRRWLWVFENLVDRGSLAAAKILTNQTESAYSVGGKRRFNLDPGLITLENFVLATGKNQPHRIYLGEGVFGDLTLIFTGGTFRPLEWTYPDYAHPNIIGLFNELRESYKCLLRQKKA